MKLIIIGNGFDLHHGFKTSFSHFKKHLEENPNKKKLVDQIDQLLSHKKPHNSTMHWNNFETIIGERIKNHKYQEVTAKKTEPIIEDFTSEFYEYLINISKKSTSQSINKNIEDEFKNCDAVLTFNYTEFYKPYILKQDTYIHHIHGKLNNENLPIIGYYYSKVPLKNSSDYEERFSGELFHKPALAFKQNEIDLNNEINIFISDLRTLVSH